MVPRLQPIRVRGYKSRYLGCPEAPGRAGDHYLEQTRHLKPQHENLPQVFNLARGEVFY